MQLHDHRKQTPKNLWAEVIVNYSFRSQLKAIICSMEKLLVTAISPLEQVIEKGFGPLLVKQGDHIKIPSSQGRP